MPQTPILIVDKDPAYLKKHTKILQTAGFQTLTTHTAQDTLAACTQHRPNIIIIDPNLSVPHDYQLIEQIKTQLPESKILVASKNATITNTIDAIRVGVCDYFIKPVPEQALLDAITNAQSDMHPGLSPKRVFDHDPILHEIGGSSPSMKHISATVQAVARSSASVFISGEIGTGKKLTAEAIHSISAQSQGPFITFNCGSLPSHAIETEFLGRVSQGTNVADQKIGAAQRAHGGVLYLDEVCALDLTMQARLLQLVETSTITPVGAQDAIPVKARIICGSSYDARKEMQAGRFRADLYYRLHVVPLQLPALRERGSDIVPITNAMIARFSAQENRPTRMLTTAAAACLSSYSWPGNIRELMNVIWNIIVVGGSQKIERTDLPFDLQNGANVALPSQPMHTTLKPSYAGMTLADVERDAIDAAIVQANGSIPQAARALDVSPSTLYRKLENWGRPPRGTRHR